ncbi:hypothetical protein O3M35_000667 [Rhynocoris fuscipes]|uniref:Glycosyltransferase 61 catalytic domain-containing protein n=1 Tax=Rhynocoris fuscipes TaxID=488301 RepID=A0AAW1DNK1_9HEMI
MFFLLLKHPVFVPKHIIQNTPFIYSSVWCSATKFGTRCSFNNLCYNPNLEIFLFIMGNRTTISGINSRNELKQITTSWMNHSHFYLKLALVDSIEEYKLITDKTILISRFKPDNIMHVIHDDLLPLYVTYKRICSGNVDECSSKFLISFLNPFNSSFNRLYEIFTNKPFLSLNSLNSIVCFSDIHVGLDSDSIFYQYGFEKPQGFVKPVITGSILYEFTEHILTHFHIKRSLNSKSTFIGREFNRKILNQNFLIELIKDIHIKTLKQNLSVNNLDINTHPIEEVIQSIANSKLLYGMHGAGMILSMFLPTGGISVELFPYGIVREHVSGLYSMSKMSGIYFGYLSWTNSKKENSLFHPEYPLLHGGIEGLSVAEKIRISTATSVPPVVCCHNPLYLHFMFQDTYVDFSIVSIVKKSFEIYKPDNIINLIYKTWYYPSQVRNINCSINNTHVIINWKPPINIRNLAETIYKITISSPKYNSTLITKSTSVTSKSFKTEKLLIWIQCVINDIEGDDTHFVCENMTSFNTRPGPD